jgi:hypothetical protein
MSFFSALGKIGLGIVHTARDVGKVGINIAGSQVGLPPIFSSNTGSDPVQTADNTDINSIVDQRLNQKIASSGKAFVSQGSQSPGQDFATRYIKPAVQELNKLDPKVTVDHTADLSASTMPSWLLPAGLGFGALLLVMSMNKRR